VISLSFSMLIKFLNSSRSSFNSAEEAIKILTIFNDIDIFYNIIIGDRLYTGNISGITLQAEHNLHRIQFAGKRK